MPIDSRAGGSAGFVEAFGQLVLRLRQSPAVAEVPGAALAAAAAVALAPAVLDAGVERSDQLAGETLETRLLTRGVDTIHVAAQTPAVELLALARALADDVEPLPATPSIRIVLVPRVGAPASAPSLLDSFQPPLPSTAPRVRTGQGAASTLEDLIDDLVAAVQRANWLQALHSTQAVIRLLPGVPDHARRGFAIIVRRFLTRDVAGQFIQLAFRVPEERPRTAEVLRWAGLDAAELMLDQVRGAESIGPREFLFEALGGMPEALPLVLPLLRSDRWYEVRHAADLLGRMAVPEAIELLRSAATHPDERVRVAAIEALGRFKDRGVVEILRLALSDPSPRARGHAGRALAARRSGALAMPLLAALEEEKDPAVWMELVGALAEIEAPEAVNALVRLATERKSILGRGGYPVGQRLELVAAIARAGTASARQALQRIAESGDQAVREAASQVLSAES